MAACVKPGRRTVAGPPLHVGVSLACRKGIAERQDQGVADLYFGRGCRAVGEPDDGNLPQLIDVCRNLPDAMVVFDHAVDRPTAGTIRCTEAQHDLAVGSRQPVLAGRRTHQLVIVSAPITIGAGIVVDPVVLEFAGHLFSIHDVAVEKVGGAKVGKYARRLFISEPVTVPSADWTPRSLYWGVVTAHKAPLATQRSGVNSVELISIDQRVPGAVSIT